MLNPCNVNIQPGQVWLCKSVFNLGLVESDIFAKVMKVFEPSPDNAKGSVHLIRTTKFGFESLPPVTMGVQSFLELYQYIGDIKDGCGD